MDAQNSTRERVEKIQTTRREPQKRPQYGVKVSGRRIEKLKMRDKRKWCQSPFWRRTAPNEKWKIENEQ
jgi:hypothetical protein